MDSQTADKLKAIRILTLSAKNQTIQSLKAMKENGEIDDFAIFPDGINVYSNGVVVYSIDW